MKNTETTARQEAQSNLHRSYDDEVFEDVPQTPQTKVPELPEQRILDTQARRELEWQLEREAVSRQIQNAYADQIVIISSDGIDEDAASVHTKEKRPARVEGDGLDCRDPNETCGDIWLAEAEAHKSPQDQIGRTSPDFPLQSKSDKGKEQEKRLTSQGEV